jgi:hypothetical protein
VGWASRVAYALAGLLVISGMFFALNFESGGCGDVEPCESGRVEVFVGFLFVALLVVYLGRMFQRNGS